MRNNVKECYEPIVNSISEELGMYKECFSFAVVADSHLDNSLDDTLANIRAVDSKVPFDCAVHLGDFLNGGFPRKIVKGLMAEQMELFCQCIGSGKFYPVRGNHDGFANLIKGGTDIRLDTDWYDATNFVDDYDNVTRDVGKPYFCVDFPENKVRLIIINSFFYKEVNDDEVKGNQNGIDDEQFNWIADVALDVGEGWTVMAFSHDTPFAEFNDSACIDNPRINGNCVMELIKKASAEKGFDFAAWFVGHFHGDYIGEINGLNFILVASETAYVPTLWDMPEGGYYPERVLGTDTEDLWDAVVLDKANRKVRLFRFGAGEDREIGY